MWEKVLAIWNFRECTISSCIREIYNLMKMRENKRILNGLKEIVQTYKIQKLNNLKTILVEYVSTELSATTFLGKG